MSKKPNVGTDAPTPSAQTWGGRLQLLIEWELIQKIDDWRRKQADMPNRSEAIRRILKLFLSSKGR